jgi:predicted ATPase
MVNLESLPPSPIRSYRILGLNHDRDIHVDFDRSAKIIIGDNGTGKTTILNALYYLLSANYWRLSLLDFESVELEFGDGEKLVIAPGQFERFSPEALIAAVRAKSPPSIRRVVEFFSIEHLQGLLEIVRTSASLDDVRLNRLFREAHANSPFPSGEVYRALRHVVDQGLDFAMPQEVVNQMRDMLKRHVPYQLLYLPTYRRVEEELANLGIPQAEDFKTPARLINFGMSDVEKRISTVTKQIIDATAHWYQLMSGRMIDELMEGMAVETLQYDQLKRVQELDLLLRRLRAAISDARREEIIKLVQSEQIRQPRYFSLAYLLSKLLEIYDKQREVENAVVQFVEIVNKYLVDKELRYDPSAVSVQIFNKRNGRQIELDRLSSGEKQLVSLFSHLYLGGEQKRFVLFDEPELSLSIDWQKELLPDIIRSNRCAFLLAATHSPFIYNNVLESVAQPVRIDFRD